MSCRPAPPSILAALSCPNSPDELRRRPAPAAPEGIGGEEKATGAACPDGENNDRMAFHAPAGHQKHAIGWL